MVCLASPNCPLLQLQLFSGKQHNLEFTWLNVVNNLQCCHTNGHQVGEPQINGCQDIERDNRFNILERKKLSELGIPIFGYSIWGNIAEFGIVCDTPI